MQDKPLDQAEMDLLAVMKQLEAERGPFNRDVLMVVARGRGLEVGRALVRLRSLGLVEEVEHRPFFLRRLFGARTQTLLRITGAADAIISAGRVVPPEPAATTPDPETTPVPGLAPEAPAKVSDISQPTPALDHGEEALQDAAPELVPAGHVDPVDEAAPGPSLPEEPSQHAPEPAPAPVRAPREAPREAPRPPLTAFTEDLGGAAIETAPVAAVALDPDTLEGLQDVLGGIGMEMTQAGEVLLGLRVAQGYSAGDALSQLVLYAFAHAVRHDIRTEGAVHALGLRDYAVEVMRELEKLRDGGEITEPRFEEDMRRLWGLVNDTAEDAEELLRDPAGGSAPPALLPEDLRDGDEDEDDDEDRF